MEIQSDWYLASVFKVDGSICIAIDYICRISLIRFICVNTSPLAAAAAAARLYSHLQIVYTFLLCIELAFNVIHLRYDDSSPPLTGLLSRHPASSKS